MSETSRPVRVRFAPSPTGHLHLGSLRTALFNYLYAHAYQGLFLIRIEDTDIVRSTATYTKSILDALMWAGLRPDEPPVIQTEQASEHEWAIKKLLEYNHAYKCYCTQKELETRCKTDAGIIRYDQKCLVDASGIDQDREKRHVIRFKIPRDIEYVSFNDMVRGTITVPTDQLDDFVIARSNHTAVYNLAVVVDDSSMEISHVIRGEDHISNTPKQILLYQALNQPVPQFGHLPLILNKDGSRLSKRDAATDVMEYKERGYLAQALTNYLARLGWSCKDQEVFSLDELIKAFDITAVGKSGATFDLDKLNWLNTVWLQKLTPQELLKHITTLRGRFTLELDSWSDEAIEEAIALYAPRSVTILDCADQIKSLHDGPAYYKKEDIATLDLKSALHVLKNLVNALDEITEWDTDTLTKVLHTFKQKYELTTPALIKPLRLALTGFVSGPPAANLLAAVGKKESIKRFLSARNHIDQETY